MDELFTLAPHSDADTSRAAARQIVPHLQALEEVVLAALRYAPMTAGELELATGLAGSTVRPRLVALRAKRADRDPLVRDSGVRRRTRSGRLAVVWEAI